MFNRGVAIFLYCFTVLVLLFAAAESIYIDLKFHLIIFSVYIATCLISLYSVIKYDLWLEKQMVRISIAFNTLNFFASTYLLTIKPLEVGVRQMIIVILLMSFLIHRIKQLNALFSEIRLIKSLEDNDGVHS